MKKHLLLILILFYSTVNISQAQTGIQQLSNYMEFLDKSSKLMNNWMECLFDYYKDAENYKKNKRYLAKYKCVRNLEEYYYKKAIGGSFRAMNNQSGVIWKLVNETDKLVKELEVYCRLEDYKSDDFKKSDEYLSQIQNKFKEYQKEANTFKEWASREYKSLVPVYNLPLIRKAENDWRIFLREQEQFAQKFSLNFHHKTYTGFDIELVKANIENCNQFKLDMTQKYQGKIDKSIDYNHRKLMTDLDKWLKSQRTTLDEFNLEGRQDDGYKNYFYLNALNYYQGLFIADFKLLTEAGKRNGTLMMREARMSGTFVIQKSQATVSNQVKTFEDLTRIPITVSKPSQALNDNLNTAYNNYVATLNEAIRKNNFFIIPLMSTQKRMNYYLGEGSKYLKETTKIRFAPKSYTIPRSLYQKTIQESQFIPEPYRKSLNQQLKVIFEIMEEMESQAIRLQSYFEKQDFLQDSFKEGKEVMARYKVLFEALDEKKEVLYNDVRKIHESYPKNQNSSWTKSQEALLEVLDDDHELLFAIKSYVKGESSEKPSEKIKESLNASLRQTLAEEYDNMKGLKKLGRYNGNCPYTPYEDIPKESKLLLDKSREKLNEESIQNFDQYEDYIYLYNRTVNLYNKFGTLSKEKQLRYLKQPKLFFIEKPKKPTPEIITEPEENTTKQPEVNMTSMEGYAYNNLILLLDVSGSMGAEDKLPLLKKSLRYLLNIMREEDEIAIVLYSGKAEVALKPISASQTKKIEKVIEGLSSHGSTNIEEGIKLAYKVADKNYIRGGNNRIVLATDGEFKLDKEIFNMVNKYATQDMMLSVFSFGKNKDKFQNLLKLVRKGKGNYEHIDEKNADYMLVKEAQSKKN